MSVRRWTKNPDEELLVGKDWTLDLEGASIVDVLDPVAQRSVVEIEAVEGVDGNITRYWLRGGEARRTDVVVIAIRTSEGELLSEHVPVFVR